MNRNLFDLSGKVAIVTGAARGMGRAIAEGYADYGAAVVLVDLFEPEMQQAAEAIRAAGGRSLALRCDVTREVDVADVIDRTLAEFGQIDIMANVAGISGRAPAEQMTLELWERVMDVNLTGTFLFSVKAGQKMIERGRGGRIINMSSTAGVVGLTTGNINYAASKGGVIAMSRCLAVEWAKHQILVNTVAPTHFRTPILADLLAQKPETLDYFLSNIPLGRLGEVEDIVGPFIFLASDAASMITGHCLMVDGGHTAK